MKLSKTFWQTYKEIPSEAEVISHQLLLRAGFIQKIAGGIYTYLPFALRVIQKISQIIREEHSKIDANEVQFSILTPAELWKETKRWDDFGPQMLKAKDRADRELCFSPTNEEAVTDLFRNTVSSYKQLPLSLYQINTKFRDEIRPRFGLLRGREFLMKDAYSFHLNKPCLDKVYEDYYQCYQNIFNRIGLDYIIVEADAGAMGKADSKTHEFQVIADNGEDVIVEAKPLNYAANLEKAKTFRPNLDWNLNGKIHEVETKHKSTCAEVAEFLNQPIHHTLKTLVYSFVNGDVESHAMVMLLGDDTLNEVKLKNYLQADHIYIAKESTLAELKLVPGYMGPYQVNFHEQFKLIYDEAIHLEAHYTIGANKIHSHLQGFKPNQHSQNFDVIDLRLSQAGDLAFDGKTPVQLRKGIEVGHIFQLGDKYTESMNVKVLDEHGKRVTPIMGCYGIGVTRTMSSAIEQSHDADGIIWPINIAPFQVHFISLCKTDEIKKLTQEIYQSLITAGIEVLFDDRNIAPGMMFKDADLLGLPIRLTLGERDYLAQKTLEIKMRKTKEVIKVSLDETIPKIKLIIEEMKNEKKI